jgi:hypothetical protein
MVFFLPYVKAANWYHAERSIKAFQQLTLTIFLKALRKAPYLLGFTRRKHGSL